MAGGALSQIISCWNKCILKLFKKQSIKRYNSVFIGYKNQTYVLHFSVGDSFPGLYTVNLLENCWSVDGVRVLVNTPWRSEDVAVVINTETKTVTKLPTGRRKTVFVFNS